MGKEIEITLPKLGESIVSATVVQWLKKEGDAIQLDEPIVEVATDKVNSEIPSPVAGTIRAILASPEQVVEVGAPLARITPSDAFAEREKAPPQELSAGNERRGLFTPVVMKMAREKGLDLDELADIPATGMGGRLSKRDLERYLHMREKEQGGAPSGIEKIEVQGMRKKIADNMVRSFYAAPHATLIHEVNVSEIADYISREKEAFFKRHGCKLSITSFIAKAILEAIVQYPLINSSFEGDAIAVKRFVHLGIAVNVDGGVLVPVIRNCHELSIREIAGEIAKVASSARRNRLNPEQMSDGTITLTNFGMSGTAVGIPIIRHPEVAIVGVGTVQKRVVALENDAMGIRSMVFLSLTFDHRVLDGMYGCGFLAAVQEYLEGTWRKRGIDA